MVFARGEISSKGRAAPGCCFTTPWLIRGLCLLIKICFTQPPKQGKTLTANLGNFCSGLGPAGCGEALCKPRQMEKVGKPRSLSLCPHYAPFLSANAESLLLSHCFYTHPSPRNHLLIPATSHQGQRVLQHLRQRQSSWV